MVALSEISKKRMTAEEKAEAKRNQTQARVGLASNVIGLGAGGAGLYAAAKDPNLRKKIGSTHAPKPSKVTGKTKAIAGGLLALQAANIGGDVVANRVLARNAKSEPVKKSAGAKAGAAGATTAATAAAAAGLKKIGESARAGAKAKNTKGLNWQIPVALGATGGGGLAYGTSRYRKKRREEAEDMEKAYYDESITDIYVSKADRTVGYGRLIKADMSDEEFDRRLRGETRKQRRALTGAAGATGAISGGLIGSVASSTLKGKKIARNAAIGAAIGAPVVGGIQHMQNQQALKKIKRDPVKRYAVERNIKAMDRLRIDALNAQARRAQVGKSFRRFDPEADRQRRLGLGAGAGLAGAAVLGQQAAKKYTVKLTDKKGNKVRGIAVKPKKGRAALLLTGGAAASGGLGALAYRKGVSERNNPWN